MRLCFKQQPLAAVGWRHGLCLTIVSRHQGVSIMFTPGKQGRVQGPPQTLPGARGSTAPQDAVHRCKPRIEPNSPVANRVDLRYGLFLAGTEKRGRGLGAWGK